MLRQFFLHKLPHKLLAPCQVTLYSTVMERTITTNSAGSATEIRTPVPALKGLCPSPLDDGATDTPFPPSLGIETPVRIRQDRDANDNFRPLDATAQGAPLVNAPSEVQAPAGQEPVLLANGSCPPHTGVAR